MKYFTLTTCLFMFVLNVFAYSTTSVYVEVIQQEQFNDSNINCQLMDPTVWWRSNKDAIRQRKTPIDKSAVFIFEKVNTPCYLSLYFEATALQKQNLELFLVQPGDSVCIYVTPDTVLFSGKTQNKFRCQYLLAQTKASRFNTEEYIQLGGATKEETFLVAIKQRDSTTLQKKLTILNRFSGTLDTAVWIQLKQDIISDMLYRLYSAFRFSVNNASDTAQYIRLRKFYERWYKTLPYSINEVMISNGKLTSAALLEKLFIAYKLSGDTSNRLSWISKEISRHYTGLLRERLMAEVFVRLYTGIDIERTALQKEMNAVQNSSVAVALQKLLQEKSIGQKAFEFSLINNKNETITLNQFKNKLIIIDFWFTGCRACLHLTPWIHRMHDSLKDKAEVIFLTVNTDADRDTWLRSLKEGKYTTAASINLYTGGLRSEHPLLKHYGYSSFPSILIIGKDGTVIATKPEPPHDEQSLNNFLQFIRSSL